MQPNNKIVLLSPCSSPEQQTNFLTLRKMIVSMLEPTLLRANWCSQALSNDVSSKALPESLSLVFWVPCVSWDTYGVFIGAIMRYIFFLQLIRYLLFTNSWDNILMIQYKYQLHQCLQCLCIQLFHLRRIYHIEYESGFDYF